MILIFIYVHSNLDFGSSTKPNVIAIIDRHWTTNRKPRSLTTRAYNSPSLQVDQLRHIRTSGRDQRKDTQGGPDIQTLTFLPCNFPCVYAFWEEVLENDARHPPKSLSGDTFLPNMSENAHKMTRRTAHEHAVRRQP